MLARASPTPSAPLFVAGPSARCVIDAARFVRSRIGERNLFYRAREDSRPEGSRSFALAQACKRGRRRAWKGMPTKPPRIGIFVMANTVAVGAVASLLT